MFPWEVPTRSKRWSFPFSTFSHSIVKHSQYADGPAEYNFEYKVADDEQQNYIARQESR